MIKNLSALLVIVSMTATAQSQNGYSNYKQQTDRLYAIAKNYPQLVKLKSIARTNGGKDAWMLVIGDGNTEMKPAIAIVGGVEGNHLLGMEMAIGFAEKILLGSQADSIKNLLAKTSFYVFPNMSPDAMEQYFAALKYERQGNNSQTDDDRDGKLNEDGYDDLDGNGKITWMRIESPTGDYKTNPDDPRALVKADLSKGEKGKYLLLSEGIDNDKDGSLNEDGEAGVWFNKNLSFKHPSFTPGAGEFAVSEIETKALLDNLYQLFNVYAVISFSANNNLSAPFPFVAATTTPRVVAGYLEPDAKANAMLSDLYIKTTGLKDAPKTTPAGGDFLSWAYYHYGRFSYSTPGWFVPKTKPDTSKKEKAFIAEDPQANYLRWALQQGVTDSYTEWKKINHPDYPGQNVEVGGLDPFVLVNPPYKLVAGIVKTHTDFIVQLAAYQPELDIINVKTDKLGAGITRVTATVINRGALPSHAKLGERSYWIKRINVKVETEKNQSVISGKKIQLLNALEGYDSKELSWLIKGPGKITLEAGSPTTGSKKTVISL
ncbi:MAG: M14 family metallopeptidase [Chitinophagaceae bacterium]